MDTGIKLVRADKLQCCPIKGGAIQTELFYENPEDKVVEE